MKITLNNKIQIGDEQELIHQVFETQYQQKNGWHYLVFTNEDKEKVILKFDAQQLTMTRFSTPKSILHFVKKEQVRVDLPTPLGLQPFITDTHRFLFQEEKASLLLQYDLKPLGGSQVFASYQMVISWA